MYQFRSQQQQWLTRVCRLIQFAGWEAGVCLLWPMLGLAGLAQTAAATERPLPAPADAAICPAQLGSAIDRITQQLPQVRWGILVQAIGDTPHTLFAQNAQTWLIPASNNKILTTAAALQRLGASYRIRTAVYGDRPPPNVTSLRIVGHGDPTLTTASLMSLAQQLSQTGIRQITHLIGDDTYFRGAAVNPTWEPEDTLAGYGAAVNGLMLNQNAIGLTLYPQRVGQPLRVQWDDPSDRPGWQVVNRSVTVAPDVEEFVDAVRDAYQPIIYLDGQLQAGAAAEPIAVSVPNPGDYLVQKLRTLLAATAIGVQSARVVQQPSAPPERVELAAVESPPLAQLLIETNRESNNIYAEALLKTIGQVQFPRNPDATASGIAAVNVTLTPLGVKADRYRLTDGSGLSVGNRVAPEALVQTLQAMAQSPAASSFRNSLAIAGVNGTLKNRFRNTIAQGRVHAKTGTISGVVALSGYATPPNYPPLVFSILTNHADRPTAVRNAVDDIVLLLMRLRSC